MTHFKFVSACLALSLGSVPVAAQDGPQAKLTTVELTAGMHVIRSELAVTADERDTSLMFRRGMASNDGMLLVYDDSAVRCLAM